MQQIAAALDKPLYDLPWDSDISGGDDDSDINEPWLPVRDHNVPSSDDNHNDDDDVGPVCDDGDHSEDNELPDLDQSDIPGVVCQSIPWRGRYLSLNRGRYLSLNKTKTNRYPSAS